MHTYRGDVSWKILKKFSKSISCLGQMILYEGSVTRLGECTPSTAEYTGCWYPLGVQVGLMGWHPSSKESRVSDSLGTLIQAHSGEPWVSEMHRVSSVHSGGMWCMCTAWWGGSYQAGTPSERLTRCTYSGSLRWALSEPSTSGDRGSLGGDHALVGVTLPSMVYQVVGTLGVPTWLG